MMILWKCWTQSSVLRCASDRNAYTIASWLLCTCHHKKIISCLLHGLANALFSSLIVTRMSQLFYRYCFNGIVIAQVFRYLKAFQIIRARIFPFNFSQIYETGRNIQFTSFLSCSAVCTYNDKNNEVGDSKMIGTICILHVNDTLEKIRYIKNWKGGHRLDSLGQTFVMNLQP